MSLNFEERTQPLTKPELEEPGAFSGALQQGDVDRVLVGFEFEFCMPNSKIKQINASVTSNITATEEEIFQQLRRRNLLHYTPYGNTSLANFNKCFKVKPGFKYPTLGMGLRGLIDATIDKCIKIFYEIPEEERARISKLALQRLRNQGTASDANTFCVMSASKLLRYKTDQISYLVYFCYEARRDSAASVDWNIFTKYKKIYNLIYERYITYSYLLYFITGAAKQSIELNPQDYLDIVSIDAAKNMLSIGASNNSDNSYMNYSKAVSVLCQSYINKTPVIFTRYHEKPKNLVDWYIEPDGSVKETATESGGELVSPPFSPTYAMDMLRQFYAMSVEGQFKVSKTRRTGLHINVSIPKKIDLLKLAIFTADDRILTQFGRHEGEKGQEYAYARSVMKSLKRSLSSNTKLTTDTRVDSDKVLPQIESIAKKIMKQHTASISAEKTKFISFRSVGFDYLSPEQFRRVIDAVGTFVRAILIASDPNAYRAQYLKKLQELLGTHGSTKQKDKQKDKSTTSELITLFKDIKQNGIPAIKTISYLSKNNRKASANINVFSNMLLGVSDLISDDYKLKEIINTPERDATDEEKKLLIDAITISDKPVSIEDTLGHINDPSSVIKTITLTTPKNAKIISKMINLTDTVVKLQKTSTYSGYIDYIGYGGWGLVQPIRIPITDDPSTTDVLKYLKSEIKKSQEQTQKLNLPEMIQEETLANKIYYFAYGMLTDESKMKHLNAKKIGRAVLSDFKLELLQHANIVKESGSKVVGVLWEIDKDAQDVLDQIEGYPVYYNRIVVPVKTDTDVIDAEVYIMTDQSRKHSYEHGYPTQRYVDDIVRGYRAARININQLITALNELNDRVDDEK